MTKFPRRNILTAGSGLMLAAAAGLSRPSFAQDMASGDKVGVDAYSYMLSNPDLTTWLQLITAGGLEQGARGGAPFTQLPASDDAFSAFPFIVKQLLGYQQGGGSGVGKSTMQAFPDTSLIVKLVRSHTIRGLHYPGEVMGKKVTVDSLAGTPITIDATNPQAVQVSWASAANGQPLTTQVTAPPVICTNAVLYITNKIETMK